MNENPFDYTTVWQHLVFLSVINMNTVKNYFKLNKR